MLAFGDCYFHPTNMNERTSNTQSTNVYEYTIVKKNPRGGGKQSQESLIYKIKISQQLFCKCLANTHWKIF